MNKTPIFKACPQDYRIDFLNDLPKNSICMEVGVHTGHWSKQIIEITNPKELHLVDIWQSPLTQYPNLKVNLVKYILKDLLVSNNVFFYKDYFKTLYQNNTFNKEYFDWIYIDANHSFLNVSQDLELSYNLVKKGGFITGDDYNHYHPEVMEAVDLFLKKLSNKVKLHYLDQKQMTNRFQYKIERIT